MRHPFLRSAGSELKDPNFKNVTLLLHGDGTNGGQNNTFVDSGPNNLPITRTGVPTQGTFSPYGDNWSNYFDGTGDYLSIARNNAFLPVANEDFAIEAFVYLTATPGAQNSIIAGLGELGTDADWFFWINSSLQVSFYINTILTSFTNTTTPLTLNTWTHVAVSRSGTGSNNLKVFVNGVGQSFTTNSTTVGTGSRALTIGADQNGDEGMLSGYVSNLRLVKGSAVYTANFTPSTAPLTAITNTSLLTCQSNRFRDASTNNSTITRNGDVSVQRFSPFSPTAAYAAGTIGGSGYFPTTSNSSITVSSSTVNIDTNPFTVESWIYYGGGGIRTWYNPASGLPFHVNGTTLRCYHSGGFIAAGPIEVNAWTHIAVTRDASNILRVFLNGVLSNSGTVTGAYNSTTPIIGDRAGLGQPFLGYIAGFRLLIGTALYTSTFTPPTSPPTSIADTRWLVNFTNAAILDNAMMAVPETVGNAQIDTTIKKFGTGSLEFDGTGDYLSIPPTSEFEFGTGDFTVECWFYASTVSGGEIPVYKQHGGADAICEIRISSSKIYGKTVTDQTVGAGTTTLSTNTWYHVAFVKSSNVYSLYLNGVSEGGTVTNATRINRPTTVRVGGNQTAVFFFTGYIDDLRVTKGVARYTANFTPPTAPFPNL